MNDSEVVSALYHCNGGDCEECKALGKCHADWTFLKEAYRLIKRQQAEIDRLNIDLKAMRGAANSWKAEVKRICKKEFDNIEIDIEAIKSEAVREFAERYKKEITERYEDIAYKDLFFGVIDRLVEEMGCNDG